ncbi:MAG TPA: NAD-dependent deacylase [Patescibacteria group bacterium]|nr:NAD-dependent deacylase [Patescibacteria group bacterium]
MPIAILPSDRLFVLTGAGISAESGIPTFRGAGGLWEGNRAEDLATPQAFDRDPELVWRFYSMRRDVAASCQSNPAHIALARLEEKLGSRMLICTQNVDGLHEAAGSNRVLHMHGEFFKSRCSNPRCPSQPFEDAKTYRQLSEIPKCPVCQSLIRPHICWFGEIPFHMNTVFAELEQSRVFLAVGTSGVVQPAAGFAQLARQNGAKTYYVGPENPANASAFQKVFAGPAGQQLPELLPLD